MPPIQWSDKRERQYEHIKEGLEERGKSEKVAEEIAARTVNKERAQHGEARTAVCHGSQPENESTRTQEAAQR